MDDTYFDVSGDMASIEFGSDELSPLNQAGSIPTYPSAPTEGAGWYDNAGSIGTCRGLYLAPADYYFLKDWQFNYCTNSGAF